MLRFNKSKHFFVKYSWLILAVCFSASTIHSEPADSACEWLYSWINDLRVRDDSGKIIGVLKEYDPVCFSGRKSSVKEKLVLREQAFDDYNYWITTGNGLSGWVYGGGLKEVEIIKNDNGKIIDDCFTARRYLFATEKLKENKDGQCKIVGSELYTFLNQQILADTLYKRPIKESGCLGILHEYCLTSNILTEEIEGGSIIIFFNHFKFLSGIQNGTDNKTIISKCGIPLKENTSVYEYELSYNLKKDDYEVMVDFVVRFFFDYSGNVVAVTVKELYNEDC